MELTSYHTCRVIATFLPSFQFFLIFVSLLFSFCLPPLLQHVQYILVLFSLHIYPLIFFPNLFIQLFSFSPDLLYFLKGKFIRRGCEKNTGALLDHTENELESVDCVSVLQYQLCSNPGQFFCTILLVPIDLTQIILRCTGIWHKSYLKLYTYALWIKNRGFSLRGHVNDHKSPLNSSHNVFDSSDGQSWVEFIVNLSIFCFIPLNLLK